MISSYAQQPEHCEQASKEYTVKIDQEGTVTIDAEPFAMIFSKSEFDDIISEVQRSPQHTQAPVTHFSIDAGLRADVVETLRKAGCPCLAQQVLEETMPDYHIKYRKDIDEIKEQAARDATLAESTRLMDEFKWMRPQCFGNHDAYCDTKCAWVVRQHCVNTLRQPAGEQI